MTIEFGVAQAIDAQAFGEPGNRTFRLRVIGSSDQLACLWVEKQQLQALDLALMQVLAQLNYEGEPPGRGVDFPEESQHEFRVGRMAIGFDPADGTVILHTFELGDDDDEEPSLRVRLVKDQCAALDVRLKEIIAAGRPVCRLCGASIDPGGHACVRSNGHSRLPIPEEDAEEEP